MLLLVVPEGRRDPPQELSCARGLIHVCPNHSPRDVSSRAISHGSTAGYSRRMGQVHGGRLVAQALKRHGTTHLFTLCGGHIQAIYDGCVDEQIRVVDTRHEQTAGHAADGYARVTGRPGVCAVTAGPGVTDVVTAVANAQRAGIPMVVIGGAGPKLLCDMGSLQDMDAVTLMRPIAKWSVQVPETRRIAEYIDSAFRIAQANVPGPVYLEMPLDLLMNFHEENDLPATSSLAEPPRPS